MKTLELKDICGYLSGRILGKHPEGDICWIDLAFVAKHGIELCNYRPVLRPMSDLTKEITHRGEKFVPLVELAKIALRDAIAKRYYNDVDFVIKNDYVEIHGHYKFRYTHRGSFEMCRTISDFDELTCLHQCEIFDKLDAWMFDYRGLISAGLAIDVNTLPENPYER